MKNCYIYVRVSTDEQAKEGYSIDNQTRACRDYAEINGYHVSKAFVDDGKSARTTDRQAFQELMTAVKELPVEAVIIYKIDRFARNVGDFSGIRRQFKNMGVKLLSVSENGDVTEGLIGNIFASVAEWESDVNGQRTKDALMQKYREGWQPTPPCLGYRSVGGEKERKTCEPHPYTAPVIRELFEIFSTGNYSIWELREWLNDRNITSRSGTLLGASTIDNILRNPFHYGLIRWCGQSKMGNHEPIISKDLFDTCQYVLAKHRNFLTRRRVHDFLLRGFIYCSECGSRFNAEWHINEKKLNKRNGKIAYYHCTKPNRNGCPSPYVEKDGLEEQVKRLMTTIRFNSQFVEAVVAKAKAKVEDSRQRRESEIQGCTNQKTALEIRRNKLEDALLDGAIDRESFKRKHAEINEKISNIESRAQEIESQSRLDINLIEEVLAFTRDIGKTYLEAPDFLKRHYLRFFFEQIKVKNKKIDQLVYTPIFATLKENQAVIITGDWLLPVDSNHQPFP